VRRLKGGKKMQDQMTGLLAPTDTSMGGKTWHRIRQRRDRRSGKFENLLAVLFWWLVSVGVALLIARLC